MGNVGISYHPIFLSLAKKSSTADLVLPKVYSYINNKPGTKSLFTMFYHSIYQHVRGTLGTLGFLCYAFCNNSLFVTPLQGHSGQNQGSSSHVVSLSCLRLCYQWMYHIFGCLYSFMWACKLGFLQLCWKYCIVWILHTNTNKQANPSAFYMWMNFMQPTLSRFFLFLLLLLITL